MINIKYFILLCATFYTATLTFLEEQDIVDLWNTIKTDGNDYIVYENFVIAYKGEEKDEFLNIIQRFGTQCENCGVFTMNYDQFKEAALQGLITIGSIAQMHTYFDSIAKKENAQYITIKNLEDFYGTDIFYQCIAVNEIKKLGDSSDGEWKLNFSGFKKVINFGLLMNPYDSEWEKLKDLDLLLGPQV